MKWKSFCRTSAVLTVSSLIAIGVFLGCGGGDNSTTTQTLEFPEELEGSVAAGFVVQVNPVFIVPSLNEAPAGAQPVASAEVRIVDRSGTVVAKAITNVDGSFTLEELPTGLLEAQARLDPNSEDSDATIFFSSIPKGEVILGQTFEVSREEASELVLDGVPDTALVAGTLNPLPQDTIVFASFGDKNGNPPSLDQAHTVGTDPEWLYMVDPSPEAQFSHEVEYVFVNSRTGDLTRLPEQVWWPAVNFDQIWFPGWFVSFPNRLGTLDFQNELILDLFEKEELPQSFRVSLSPDLIQIPRVDLGPDEGSADVTVVSSTRQADPGQNSDILAETSTEDLFGFVVVGIDLDPWLSISGTEIFRWMKNKAKIPEKNIKGVISGASLPSLKGEGLGESFEDLFGVIFETPSGVKDRIRSRFFELEELIKKRRADGGHPTLVISWIGHGHPAGKIMLGEVNAISGVIITFFGKNEFLFPIDEAIPAQESSACNVIIMLSTCRAKSHLDLYRKRFEEIDVEEAPIVSIFTASGTGFGQGRAVYSFIYAAVLENVENSLFGETFDVKPDTNQRQALKEELGTFFVRKWVNNASLSTDGEVSFGGGLSFLDVDDPSITTLRKNDLNLTFFRDGNRCKAEDVGISGTYGANFTVDEDPSDHESVIGLTDNNPRSLTVTVDGDNITVSGSDPFVDVSGSIDENDSFSSSGIGTVAGNDNVTVFMSGTFNNGAVSGTYSMGGGGGLPGGQPVSYDFTANKQ